MHRFLESCAGGDPEKVDLRKLDYGYILEAVECKEFSLKIPGWIQKIVTMKEKKPQGGPVGGPAGGGRRTPDGDGGRNKKIGNPEQHDSCKLRDGENFKLLFHPMNLKGMEKPVKKNGDMICMRFHTMGYCFSDCRYSSGHGVPSGEEERERR